MATGKRVLAILFLAFVLIALAVICTPDKPNQHLIREIFHALEQIATTGVADIDMELERIYQHLYETEGEILKLEQVMKPALDWVEYQKSIERGPGNWLISVQSEELAKLCNDQYKVTKVEVFVESSSTPNQKFSSEIILLDQKTGTIDNGQVFESTLKELQKSLEQQAEVKLKARTQLISTLNSLIASGSRYWKIQRTFDRTYIINAPNLGWADEIAAGKWTYDIDAKKLEPADSGSAAMKNLLLGLF